MTNGNEPINTVVEHTDGSTMRLSCTEIGLTKREYFAAMAMQGMLSQQYWASTENLASCATQAADALINALNETK